MTTMLGGLGRITHHLRTMGEAHRQHRIAVAAYNVGQYGEAIGRAQAAITLTQTLPDSALFLSATFGTRIAAQQLLSMAAARAGNSELALETIRQVKPEIAGLLLAVRKRMKNPQQFEEWLEWARKYVAHHER